jgi:hypothetical protein
MAFHPFRHFRKHQKVYLAIVTILTMFIFIFTGFASRGADPVTRMLMWIGGGRHGEKVLNLYGKSIYTDDLEKLRWQRQLASEFVLSGCFMSPMQRVGTPLEESFFRIQEKFGPKKGQNELPTPMQNTINSVLFDVIFSQPHSESHFKELQTKLRTLQRQLNESQNKEDQARALDALVTMLAFQSWVADPQRQQEESYFGGSLRSKDVADFLDFLIWKHQADRLGIVLTQADVCRLVNRAWGDGSDFLKPDAKFETNDWVERFFRGSQKIHKSLTPNDLLNALTDEFRMALAKEALLGTASGARSYRQAVDGIHHSPTAATPDEFYKYFQEQRTALSVSILPIAVKSFVDQVQAKPTEADLRNLYDRYKNDEPLPTRRQPGFKEPRRIQLQYLSYHPEGPFARKLAAKASELLPVFRVGQPASAFAAGGGVAWAANLAAAVDLDTAIQVQYEKYRNEETGRVLKYDKDEGNAFTSSSRFGQGFDLNNQQAAQAQAPAALVGQWLGSAGTCGTVLAGPVTWLGTEELYDRARQTLGASTVLAAASSSPLTAMVLPTRYLHSAQPLEVVRNQMIERFETTMARTLMTSNVLNFRKELDKVLATHSEQKLDEFLKKSIPEYGLEDFHSMKEAQTQQEMLDNPDPQLQELQTAWDKAPSKPFQEPSKALQDSTKDPSLVNFVRDMFFPFETQRAGQPPPIRSEEFSTSSRDVFWVLWKSKDLPAHIRPFDVVRKEVEDAWYTEQARKVARAKAQQINEELRKQNLAPDAAVQFLVQQNLGSVFQLNKISHLTAPEFNLPGQKPTTGDYRPYVPPRELLPYPPADFVDQLLKLKQRGDSLVFADKPVKNFYIAVLMENPQPPERREFYDVYGQLSLDNLGLLPVQEEQLWYKMMADQQRKFTQRIMEQLRAEATKDLQDGEYVLPESVRNRADSGRDSGE